MRVAFHDGAVHKCAGVTFVGIAHHVLGVGLLPAGKFPFPSGGETAAAASTQTGALYFFYYRFRRTVQQAVCQCAVTVQADVFFYILRVDEAAVS